MLRPWLPPSLSGRPWFFACASRPANPIHRLVASASSSAPGGGPPPSSDPAPSRRRPAIAPLYAYYPIPPTPESSSEATVRLHAKTWRLRQENEEARLQRIDLLRMRLAEQGRGDVLEIDEWGKIRLKSKEMEMEKWKEQAESVDPSMTEPQSEDLEGNQAVTASRSHHDDGAAASTSEAPKTLASRHAAAPLSSRSSDLD